MTWTYEYNEYGGYDMMTSGYDIFKDGENICYIDTGRKGQDKESEEMVILIVTAVNKFLSESEEKTHK